MTTAQPNRTGQGPRSDAEWAAAEAAAVREMRLHPTVSITTAGESVRAGREKAYAAADAGHIPTVRIGRERRVPSALMLALLGLGPEPAALPMEGDRS